MSFPSRRIRALYQRDLRISGSAVEDFAALRDSSPFICISLALFNWSNERGMQI